MERLVLILQPKKAVKTRGTPPMTREVGTHLGLEAV